jgi:hypothetical protein
MPKAVSISEARAPPCTMPRRLRCFFIARIAITFFTAGSLER